MSTFDNDNDVKDVVLVDKRRHKERPTMWATVCGVALAMLIVIALAASIGFASTNNTTTDLSSNEDSVSIVQQRHHNAVLAVAQAHNRRRFHSSK